jgi:hypothetical protein
MAGPSRVAPPLPEDILRTIFRMDTIRGDKDTLRQCTLVCHGWKESAQVALFASPYTLVDIRPDFSSDSKSKHPKGLSAAREQLSRSTCESTSSALSFAVHVRHDMRDARPPAGQPRNTIHTALDPVDKHFSYCKTLLLTSSSNPAARSPCVCVRGASILPPYVPSPLHQPDAILLQGLGRVSSLTLTRLDMFPDMLTFTSFLCSMPLLEQLYLYRVDWAGDTPENESRFPQNLRLARLGLEELSVCGLHVQSSLHAFYRWLVLTETASHLKDLIVDNGKSAPKTEQMLKLSQSDRGKDLSFYSLSARECLSYLTHSIDPI